MARKSTRHEMSKQVGYELWKIYRNGHMINYYVLPIQYGQVACGN